MIRREHSPDPSTRRTAVYSDCGRFRYSLEIRWKYLDVQTTGYYGSVACIGLNPSTATERANDPTVARLEKWAREEGYAGLVMLNAYAYRATSPLDMFAQEDREGPGNDDIIRYEVSRARRAVCCWGNLVEKYRLGELASVLDGYDLCCLKRNKNGQPAHPLYLPGPFKLHPYAIKGE